MINKKVIQKFLNRSMDNHDWMKKLSKPELLREFKHEIKTVAGFGNLWSHQLVCLLLVDVYERFMLHVDMGGGKALPDNEIVLTPKGWMPIGKLKVGQEVIGSDGKPTKVIAVFPQGIKKINNVVFSDGASVRACDDHLWAVNTPTRKWKGLPNRLKTTQQLRNDLRDTNGNRKWFIPTVKPIKLDPERLSLDPYVLGAWLGDGCRNKPMITSGDPALIQEILKRLPSGTIFRISKNSKNSWNYYFSEKSTNYNTLTNNLKRLRLYNKYSHERFIPKAYLHNGGWLNRLELLQGLIDTDGYVSKDGKCYFATSSKQLAEDVIYLARSLGGTASCRGFRPNDKKGHYSIYLTLPPELQPCLLKRKADRLINSTRHKNGPTRSFAAIARAGNAHCTCIKVAAPDGLFVTKDFILTHNTSCVLFSILARKIRGENPKAIVFVPYITAIDTWIEECKKHTPQLRLMPLLGSTTENLRLLEEKDDYDVFVMCYASAVAALARNHPRQPNKWTISPDEIRHTFEGFNTFVADEIHKCSNNTSLTYRLCRAVSNECVYGIGLSGTPFGKNIEDLWSQFYLIDFGETLGQTKGLFKEAFFKEEKNPFQRNRFAKDYKFDSTKMPILKRMVKHNSIHYDVTEMHDMPKKRYIQRQLKLPEDIGEYVKIAAAKFLAVVKSKDQANRFQLAEASYLQLRQLASGFMTAGTDTDKIKVAFDKNPKLDLLEEYIDAMPHECKMVVFHHFVYTNELISERLTKLKVGHARVYSKTKNIIKELAKFRDDPKCRVLVLNDQSGSNSLNLQHANYMYFFEQPDSPINRQQGERRIWRPGQERPVIYIDPFMEGTVDEKIFYSNQQGKKLLDQVLKTGGL